MTVNEAIAVLENAVPDPSKGLPEEIFLYLTRVTPMMNVDLLVQDHRGTLLAWRDDPYTGMGWHVPGGIVRFRERLEDRIQHVAATELGCQVTFSPEPVAMHQLISPWLNNRSHFVSFLYRCGVPREYEPENPGPAPIPRGSLRWFQKCPENLLECQRVYRRFVDAD